MGRFMRRPKRTDAFRTALIVGSMIGIPIRHIGAYSGAARFGHRLCVTRHLTPNQGSPWPRALCGVVRKWRSSITAISEAEFFPRHYRPGEGAIGPSIQVEWSVASAPLSATSGSASVMLTVFERALG